MIPAELIASARSLIEGDPDSVGLIDRCSVINPTVINETGLPGTKLSDVVVASDVPCLYEQKTRTGSEGRLGHVTHELFLLADATTRGITPEYKIVVEARGDIPEMTFSQPILLEETFGPLVHLGAMKYVPNFGN